jgi:tetratricopeptide (TPR) repeat protein
VSEAAEHYARRLDTARQRGDVVREGLALGNLGDCRAAMGEYAAAERDLRQALDLCRKADQRRNEAHVLHSLAELLVDTGRFAEAIQCARDGQALAESISNPRLAAEHAAALARAALLAGDLTLALAAAQAADAGPRPWLAALDAAALLGVAQTVSGQHEAAQQSFAESLRHAEALLAHTPALPSALDTQGLAHAGLALLASPDHLAPARQAFEMAGHAAHAPGLAHRTLTLLDVLVGLAGGERLDELRQPLVARLAPSSQ